MNERIKELAGKALDQTVPQTWTTLTAYDLTKFTEKFAELIIWECIRVAGPEDSYTDEWFKAKADSVAKIIQHFGAEK